MIYSPPLPILLLILDYMISMIDVLAIVCTYGVFMSRFLLELCRLFHGCCNGQVDQYSVVVHP